MLPTLEFLDTAIPLLENVPRVEVKIYSASSAAALIATSLGHYREMSTKGILAFHKGSFRVSSADVESDGKLPGRLMDDIRRSDALLINQMKKFGIERDKEKMSTLLGGDFLRFNASQCVELGIVNSAF
jgi:hypothetical protein